MKYSASRRTMNWEGVDWKALERLRSAFLCGAAGEHDYWQSESDLASYDQTFAQRIGWKWDYVLEELKRRGWSPPPGELLDWGCGSGIASRAFLDHFGIECVSALCLWDRSPLAMRYAERKACEKFPGLNVHVHQESGRVGAPSDPKKKRTSNAERPTSNAEQDASATGIQFEVRRSTFDVQRSLNPKSDGIRRHQAQGEVSNASIGTLVLSHVLTELKPPQLEQLLALASRTTAILWIEPGTYQASRALIAVRERLCGRFNVVAPCTHQTACGMLAPENARHWCHHFAPSPPEVFTDGPWKRFANLAGIDLRSLPLSFFVLDKRPPPPLPPGAVQVIGRPRVLKADALLFACDASGVRERRLTKRALPDAFARLKKGEFDPLQIWKCNGDEIVDAQPLSRTSLK